MCQVIEDNFNVSMSDGPTVGWTDVCVQPRLLPAAPFPNIKGTRAPGCLPSLAVFTCSLHCDDDNDFTAVTVNVEMQRAICSTKTPE